MNEVQRIVQSIVRSDTPLDRSSVAAAATRIASEEAPLAPATVADLVADEVVGLGPLEPLLREPLVSDVLVNGDGAVWVERGGTLQPSSVRFSGPDAVVACVRRAIAPLGLRLDRSSPAVDARLPDGSRLHAIIEPAAVDGPIVAIRRFTGAVHDLDGLVAAGSASEGTVALLRDAVDQRQNILVVGPTGTGKTTLLDILASRISDTERIVSVEDAAELSISGHVVRLEARPPNTEGRGEVTLRSLLVHALRLRPDRLIVGEVRGPEAFDMVQALNTGHRGSMSTVHAFGASEAISRLAMLSMLASDGLDHHVLEAQVRTAFDMVVAMERRGGMRVVASICRIESSGIEEIGRW